MAIPKYALLVIREDLLDAAGVAAVEAALVVRRRVPDELVPVLLDVDVLPPQNFASEAHREYEMARRLLEGPGILKPEQYRSVPGILVEHHTRRTGKSIEDVKLNGLTWLLEQPDKSGAPAAPAPGAPAIVRDA